METTTVNIPQEVLHYWKDLEHMSDKNKVVLIALLSNSIAKKRGDNKNIDTSAEKQKRHNPLPISPILKAVEIGEDRTMGLSSNYKKEIAERKMKRA